jgi:hypothetical protein
MKACYIGQNLRSMPVTRALKIVGVYQNLELQMLE